MMVGYKVSLSNSERWSRTIAYQKETERIQNECIAVEKQSVAPDEVIGECLLDIHPLERLTMRWVRISV